MAPLRNLWAGRIFGTNTGKVFLELNPANEGVAGTLKLADDQFGIATYLVEGTFQDGLLSFEGSPEQSMPEVQLGHVTATARLQPNGQLWGEWKSDLGTAGIFELFPHIGARSLILEAGPEQMYTTVRELGALRLFGDDVADMLAVLRRKFPISRIVVSHLDRGVELAQFAEEFEIGVKKLEQLKWLKINVQAPALGGISKSITIDLGSAFNRVTLQGPDESWVLGEAEATKSFLKSREKRLSTTIGKYRVNFNQLIAVGALIAMPDLMLLPRAAFVIAVLSLILLAAKLQSALIPNFVVDFAKDRPNWAGQVGPSVLSWLISATAGVATSVMYGFLQHWFK